MLTDHTIKFNKLLTPFSFLYGIGVRFRNQLFDWKILRTERYDLPIICVGNLTVGGTGKTPHTEYIIRLIKDRYRVAVLSRGYKRKTSGFLLADQRSTSKDIGDEPYQMKRKFPDILVAVDADRRRGIRNLLALQRISAGSDRAGRCLSTSIRRPHAEHPFNRLPPSLYAR